MTTTYRITPPGWQAGPLRMVAIADLHAGGPNMTMEHIPRAVDQTNALAPDIVVLLGDYVANHRFVTERVPDAAWAAEFARLAAPLGVWAILGNHDWWHDLAGVRRARERRHPGAGEPRRAARGRDHAASGSPASAISSPIGWGAGRFAASTILPARSPRSRPTTP